MAGVKGVLTTLAILVCSAAISEQYIHFGDPPRRTFLSSQYVTVVFPKVYVDDHIRAAARQMHLSPGFTCTSLMGPTCLYAENQQGSRASSGNLTMWHHLATDLPIPAPSEESACASEAGHDLHPEEGIVPKQHEAGQHQLEALNGHSGSADEHRCQQLPDAAKETVSPSQQGTAATGEPAGKCGAATSRGGEGIMAQYLAASQDQLGAVHGHSDPAEERSQKIGASSEGKLDDVVYVRVGTGGGVRSVYDGDFDRSTTARCEGETRGTCQSNEKNAQD